MVRLLVSLNVRVDNEVSIRGGVSVRIIRCSSVYYEYPLNQGSSNWGSRDWEKNSEMQQQIEVKTFFFREHLDFGKKTGKSEMKSK